jgi:hypothetical protein
MKPTRRLWRLVFAWISGCLSATQASIAQVSLAFCKNRLKYNSIKAETNYIQANKNTYKNYKEHLHDREATTPF